MADTRRIFEACYKQSCCCSIYSHHRHHQKKTQIYRFFLAFPCLRLSFMLPIFCSAFHIFSMFLGLALLHCIHTNFSRAKTKQQSKQKKNTVKHQNPCTFITLFLQEYIGHRNLCAALPTLSIIYTTPNCMPTWHCQDT